MSHTTKSTIQGHLDYKKHEVAVETMKTRDKARVEHRLEAEAEALPHRAAMRQPSLQFVVASCNNKNKAADDMKIGRHGRILWGLTTGRRGGTRRMSLLHEIHDSMTKQGVNYVVRLAFLTNHASLLIAAINLTQFDGPVAYFMYDKMKHV